MPAPSWSWHDVQRQGTPWRTLRDVFTQKAAMASRNNTLKCRQMAAACCSDMSWSTLSIELETVLPTRNTSYDTGPNAQPYDVHSSLHIHQTGHDGCAKPTCKMLLAMM